VYYVVRLSEDAEDLQGDLGATEHLVHFGADHHNCLLEDGLPW